MTASITSVEPAVTRTCDGSTPCRLASARRRGGCGDGDRFASPNARSRASRTAGDGGSVFSFEARRMSFDSPVDTARWARYSAFDGRRCAAGTSELSTRPPVCAPVATITRGGARKARPRGRLRARERSPARAVASVPIASAGVQKTAPGSPARTASAKREIERSNGCTVIEDFTRRSRTWPVTVNAGSSLSFSVPSDATTSSE